LKVSRYTLLKAWLASTLSPSNEGVVIDLQSMTGDAGFRQYYRFEYNGKALIGVDAPPQYSNNLGFSVMQQALTDMDVTTPQIIAADLQQGFFCISDLGDQLLADALVEQSSNEAVQQTYLPAINLLPRIAKTQTDSSQYKLPLYDQDFIELELAIFSQWLLEKHLGIELSEDDKEQLAQCFEFLVDSALSQPQVTMHRDFHSRNIMMLDDGDLGIIDFQDAVHGPITYDIVSLLRDCYTRWPDEVVQPLFKHFTQLMSQHFELSHVDEKQWQQWFDLMGLQRHLKASGIFCRLFHRDNKGGYLKDIPLTLSYIEDISAQYPQLNFLHQLTTHQVIPALKQIPNNASEIK